MPLFPLIPVIILAAKVIKTIANNIAETKAEAKTEAKMIDNIQAYTNLTKAGKPVLFPPPPVVPPPPNRNIV